MTLRQKLVWACRGLIVLAFADAWVMDTYPSFTPWGVAILFAILMGALAVFWIGENE